MKPALTRFVLPALMLAALPAVARQDIDIYAGTSDTAAPNVLFYLDNSSNWSSNGNKWSYSTVYAKCASTYSGTQATTCQSYVNQVFCSSTSTCSGSPTLTQGQVELRALKLVLNETYCNATGASKLNYNVGLMLGATASTAGSSDSSSVGTSYIRHAIREMSSDQCATSVSASADLTKYLMADLTNIDAKIQDSDFKSSSSAEYGAGLFDAFKYFGGWTNPSGAPGGTAGGATGVAGSPANATHFGTRRYSNVNSYEDDKAFVDGSGKLIYRTPSSEFGTCGNNYIILIGNTWPNQEYGTDQNASPPTNTLIQRLTSASGTTPSMANPSQLYSVSSKSNIRFADEWAKFLYTTDVSDAAGKQNVKMFTIDVYNAAPDANQSALLKQMAKSGQGTETESGYFKIGGDLYALVNALKDILTQISAVNSVFASAALPVSVNAQGTYVNQVFMGLFRPDESFQQRWFGNLKQFKFAKKGTSGSLYLADSTTDTDGYPKEAVDTANTGFLKNCATSYWTSDSSYYWEKITGTTSNCSTQSTSLYSDSPDGPIVERGGAGQKLRTLGYASRNIRTCTSATSCTTALVDFNTTNVTSISGFDTATTADLVNWARGQNIGDGTTTATGTTTYTQYTETNTGGVALSSTSTRPTVHGEVVHSTPLAVNYGSTSNDIVVFYGAGDGMLHAVDGNQTGTTAGQELWAFVAPEHWSNLGRLRTNSPLVKYGSDDTPSTITPTPQRKTYFFDGPITGYQDASGASMTKLWIYSTMRRGGNMIYGFDVSKKPGSSTTNQPKVLWKFGCAYAGSTDCATGATGESSMGQSWSAPVVIRVKDTSEPLVVFGGGYHECEDTESTSAVDPCASVSYGKGIYVMSAEKGSSQNYRFIAPTATGVTTGRFVADIATADVNGDGYIDLLYAVDTRGNIWRINVSDPDNGYAGYTGGVSGWPAPKLVATAAVWGTTTKTERRKFMYAPSVVVLGTTQSLVLVGSGDREKPSDAAEAAYVKNRFYGIKDSYKVTPASVVAGYDPVTALVNVSSATDSAATLSSVAAAKGWYLNLYSSTNPYEQVVTTPLTIGGVTYFNTYQAKDTTSGSTCSNLGTAYGYQVDFQTGIQQLNDLGAHAPVTFLSQGIPTSPRGGQVDLDGKTETFCISCASNTNKTILNPTQPPVKLRTNRTPVYRYQRIDSQ